MLAKARLYAGKSSLKRGLQHHAAVNDHDTTFRIPLPQEIADSTEAEPAS